MPQVNVTINGKNYRMACDEGQEPNLLELSRKFDGYVDGLKGSFGEIGDQRLTIMAGIMVLDELTELQNKTRIMEADIESLRANRDLTLSMSDQRERDIASGLSGAAERIEKIANKLNGS